MAGSCMTKKSAEPRATSCGREPQIVATEPQLVAASYMWRALGSHTIKLHSQKFAEGYTFKSWPRKRQSSDSIRNSDKAQIVRAADKAGHLDHNFEDCPCSPGGSRAETMKVISSDVRILGDG